MMTMMMMTGQGKSASQRPMSYPLSYAAATGISITDPTTNC